ncbi:MAG: hypothetical protein LC102_00710 [Ignavibacteriales bacterium]|nr:MAG: hypothetical protein F9K26_03570 [Ignavibacteriaceae bacterium]MBW7872513.1 hypothetical protein [Ignavibacteria bacterium]MCZ2141934.1 hypothetical protein [Ignavibacteriales bacterium]OQY73692.1 MAG: hypothetical protein B6D45_07800 [Ignavibacteriales bacterium UTCHB3]MBV6445100.1 hypothetical protein [Ignavibacteriaceae bacterium]
MNKLIRFYRRYYSTFNISAIVILALLLIKVAYLDPSDYAQKEEFYKTETRMRLHNLRAAERAWFELHGSFCGNIDTLIAFVRSSEAAIVLDSTKNLDKSTFGFQYAGQEDFIADSMKLSPKLFLPFIIQLDTFRVIDSVFSEKGEFTRVDTTAGYGSRFRIIDPAGFGSVGNLHFDALIYSASWE